jgi:hypothetical protein
MPSNVSTSLINVSNVKEANQLKTTIAGLSDAERERRESLAFEISDQMNRLAGHRDPELHRSAGFHRRVAFLMPEHLVREALAAVRDAADDSRGGRKTINKGYAAYFAGVVKKLADREHIDLGLKQRRQTAPTASDG